MQTLALNRSECVRLLDPGSIVEDLRDAFIAYSTASVERAQRIRAGIGPAGSSTVLFPGTAPGIPAYTVKVHAKFPSEEPAIRGVLCLHDEATGALLCVMDSTYLTAVRTGIAGALAAHTLATASASRVAVIGAGVQGAHQLRALAGMRPLARVLVFDTNPSRADTYASRLGDELGLAIEVARSVEHAAEAAEIILAATWSSEPFIHPGMLAAGTHVTTLGADEPGKAEVSADLIRSALFICDDRQLAVEMGALAGVGLGAEAATAELGDVLAAVHPGRTDPNQITVFGGVGLAFQDAVAAWQIYRAALRVGSGQRIDFLA